MLAKSSVQEIFGVNCLSQEFIGLRVDLYTIVDENL